MGTTMGGVGGATGISNSPVRKCCGAVRPFATAAALCSLGTRSSVTASSQTNRKLKMNSRMDPATPAPMLVSQTSNIWVFHSYCSNVCVKSMNLIAIKVHVHMMATFLRISQPFLCPMTMSTKNRSCKLGHKQRLNTWHGIPIELGL